MDIAAREKDVEEISRMVKINTHVQKFLLKGVNP